MIPLSYLPCSFQLLTGMRQTAVLRRFVYSSTFQLLTFGRNGLGFQQRRLSAVELCASMAVQRKISTAVTVQLLISRRKESVSRKLFYSTHLSSVDYFT